MQRNVENRALTIKLDIRFPDILPIVNEVARWMNAEQQKIRLRFKVIFSTDQQELSEFLNSNDIIDLEVESSLSEKLTLNESLNRSIKSLKIQDDRFIDLYNFKSL